MEFDNVRQPTETIIEKNKSREKTKLTFRSWSVTGCFPIDHGSHCHSADHSVWGHRGWLHPDIPVMPHNASLPRQFRTIVSIDSHFMLLQQEFSAGLQRTHTVRTSVKPHQRAVSRFLCFLLRSFTTPIIRIFVYY